MERELEMPAVRYDEGLPDREAYFHLFESTGWNDEYHLSPDELFAAVERSWYMVNAYDADRLVGTGRVVSDGMLHALVVDVIVLPEYRRKGIGAGIMQRLVERCRQQGIRDVQLFCARGKAPFYERLGFRARPDEAPGMELVSG